MMLTKKTIAGLAIGLALAGCASRGADPGTSPPVEQAGEVQQALTDWQCACDPANQYIASVSLFQGGTLGCPSGEAYRCGDIPWCTRGTFGQCSLSLACPPGWYVSALNSGPGYCNGVMERVGCSAIPYPSGTYATCDPACAPGFLQVNDAPDTPSCDYGTKITCQK